MAQKIAELAEKYNKMHYLTLREAANILKVSQRTLSRLVQDGFLNSYRIPSEKGEKRNYRFKLNDIEDFMNQQKVLCTGNIVKNAFKNKVKNIEKEKIKGIVKSIVNKGEGKI